MFYLFCMWFWIALKKETPCFHRPFSIQIDSPLTQGVTQPISRGSDFALHNKRPPNVIFYLFGMWFWIALKKETPCFHRPFSIQIDSPLPQGVTQPVSWESDFSIHNKRLPDFIFYLFACYFGQLKKKGNSLFPQTNFNSNWQSTAPGCHSASFKRIWCCIT